MNYIQVCLLLVMSLGMQVSYVSGQTNAHVRDLMELSPKELEAALQEVFMVTGEGGTWRRCAMIFALSSMIHSMTSPFSNSMASATAVGKLM